MFTINNLNVNEIIDYTSIYGVGIRTAIWFQGCSLKCKGCWNTEMHSFTDNQLYTPESLFDLIKNNEVEGVTLLGGEPLQQSLELLISFLNLIKQSGKSIILFTGYTLNYVKKHKKEVLDYVDVIITGKYDESKRTMNTYLIGSTNQKINYITDRYSKKDMRPDGNYIEIIIDEESGDMTQLGFFDKDSINSNKN